MSATNKRAVNPNKTHEGGQASFIKPLEQLKRSVMSCLLWENTFYEDGEVITDRIKTLINEVSESDARQVLIDAKFKSKLRHIWPELSDNK